MKYADAACRAAARGERYTIPFTGETDFVFVDDVAAAFEVAAAAPLEGAGIYNVVGECDTVERVAALIESIAPGVRIDAAGPPLPVAARIEAGDLRTVYPSVQRTSIRDGIERTVAHYREAPGAV